MEEYWVSLVLWWDPTYILCCFIWSFQQLWGVGTVKPPFTDGKTEIQNGQAVYTWVHSKQEMLTGWLNNLFCGGTGTLWDVQRARLEARLLEAWSEPSYKLSVQWKLPWLLGSVKHWRKMLPPQSQALLSPSCPAESISEGPSFLKLLTSLSESCVSPCVLESQAMCWLLHCGGAQKASFSGSALGTCPTKNSTSRKHDKCPLWPRVWLGVPRTTSRFSDLLGRHTTYRVILWL